MIFIGPQGRMNMGDYATSESQFTPLYKSPVLTKSSSGIQRYPRAAHARRGSTRTSASNRGRDRWVAENQVHRRVAWRVIRYPIAKALLILRRTEPIQRLPGMQR